MPITSLEEASMGESGSMNHTVSEIVSQPSLANGQFVDNDLDYKTMYPDSTLNLKSNMIIVIELTVTLNFWINIYKFLKLVY